MTELTIFVDKMAIQYVFAIRIQTTPASIVVYEDTWLETVSIMAEDEVSMTIREEVEILVEEAEVEDELALEEGEVTMPNWIRKRGRKRIPHWQMVGWAKPNSESRLMECQ